MIFQCSLASPRMCRQFPSGPLRCHQLFRLCSPVQLRAQSRRASQAVLLVVSQALCRRLYRRVSRVHRQVPIPQRCQVRYLRLYLLRYQVDTRLPSPVFSLQLCPQAYQAAILQLDHQLFRHQRLVHCPPSSLHPPPAYYPARNQVERLRLPRALRRRSIQGLSCLIFIILSSTSTNKYFFFTSSTSVWPTSFPSEAPSISAVPSVSSAPSSQVSNCCRRLRQVEIVVKY